jgi:NADH:ubiquinone oxidoreductase subunit E
MEPTKGDRSMNQVSATAACCGEQASHEELLGRLDGVLAEYREKPGALIPVLQIAQGIFGYLPEDVMKRVALKLGKSYSEVAGVVGFYSYFSTVPRGRHLVRVCLGTACYVRGGKLVLEGLKDELGIEVGGTTPDGQFSLEVARCFGACGLAPTIMIDEDVHQRVKPLKLRAILEQYANGKRSAKASKKAAGAAKKTARRPAAKKVAVGAVARPRVGAVARPRGKPGSTAQRTVARKPVPRGKPVRVAAKRGARR